MNLLENRYYLLLSNSIFRVMIADLQSGYGAFNRSTVKSFVSSGFEIETEITVKSLEKRYLLAEIPISTYTSIRTRIL